MKKKSGKSFFDYSDKEKQEILKHASEEGSRMQRELVEKASTRRKKYLKNYANKMEKAFQSVRKEERERSIDKAIEFFENNLLDSLSRDPMPLFFNKHVAKLVILDSLSSEQEGKTHV